jgi:hypothetical protein
MKKMMFLGPRRDKDPEVIQAYARESEACRQPLNFGQLDFLIQKREEIKRQLDATPRSKAARVRVLKTKLRGAEGGIKNLLAFAK